MIQGPQVNQVRMDLQDNLETLDRLAVRVSQGHLEPQARLGL